MKQTRKNYTIQWLYSDESGDPYTGTSVVNAYCPEDAIAAVQKKYGHKKGFKTIRVLIGDFAPEQEHLFAHCFSKEVK